MDAAGTFPPGRLNAGFGRRTSRDHIDHQDSLYAESISDLVFRDLYSDPRPYHLSITDEFRDDTVDRIHGNSKPDSRGSAGGAIDRGVHANQPARAIKQGPSGVSRIDGSICLNNALNGPPRHRFNFSAECADDACG